MSDRPILFSAPMVRALLAGTKTQTRRIMKPQPRGMPWFWEGDEVDPEPGWFDGYETGREPCGAATSEVNDPIKLRIGIGDMLWVKETWRPFSIDFAPWDIEVAYAADGERRIIKDGEFGENDWNMPKAAERGNVSPLFMPRWASRLTLTVTDVRVERLHAISEADAIAEGVPADFLEHIHGPSGYRDIWETINGAGAWETNPWVAAYSFEVHRGNIGQIGGAA